MGVRWVNLNPEIAPLQPVRLLLLRILARPDRDASSTVASPVPLASASEVVIRDEEECLRQRRN
jgi:hypothetical protein